MHRITKYYLIICKTAVDCAELVSRHVDVFAIAAKLPFWCVVMGGHGMNPGVWTATLVLPAFPYSAVLGGKAQEHLQDKLIQDKTFKRPDF